MDNQNDQKPNQGPKDDNTPSRHSEPTPRHSEFISESQNKIPKQVRDDNVEKDTTSAEGPEDMLAGTDETPTPTSEPTAVSSTPPTPPRHSEPILRHSELGSESSLEEPNKQDAVIPAEAGISPSQRLSRVGDQKETETEFISESDDQPIPPPPVDNTPEFPKISPEPKPNKAWLWVIIVAVILGLATAVTYYLGIWPFSDRQIQISQEPVESFVPLFYRASTLPSGTLIITNGTVIANINNLQISETGQFAYKLVLTGDNTEQESGSFVGSNANGMLVDENGNEVTLKADDISEYSTARVAIYDSQNDLASSIIMQGQLIKDNSQSATANLSFPFEFDDIFASAVLSEVPKGDNTIELSFDTLPNLADIGYMYEARLVEFDGPYISDELSLGKFQGGDINTSFNTKLGRNLSRYNQLVISLEPTWDKDSAISQIKPFSGNI